MKWLLIVFYGLNLVTAAGNNSSTTVTDNPVEEQIALQPTRHSLWGDIKVKTAKTHHVVEPTSISNTETVNPPRLPTLKSDHRLPHDFVWGWAATAGQIEGAVDADGRGPSIWDIAAHKSKGFIANNETLDITANHYYLYKQDALRTQEMNIPYYSLTISWSRILPDGDGAINKVGLQHYIDEIDYLRKLNITPIVTLYHWDLPQALQISYGGFLNEKIVEDFGNYARIIYKALGDKVPIWITMNEPQVFCEDYKEWPKNNLVKDKVFPVHGMKNPLKRLYTCGHNALLAHAEAVRILREEFPHLNKSKVSFANSWDFTPPLTSNSLDRLAAERSLAFSAGWMGNPVYIDGDYPSHMRQALGTLLPKFTAKQSKLLLNSTDFYAWDAYTGYPVTAVEDYYHCLHNKSHEAFPQCIDEWTELPESGWPVGNEAHVGWLHDTPELFRRGVLWSWDFFRPGEYFIPEFGFAPWRENEMRSSRARYDQQRVGYYEGYCNAILQLVNEDFVNLKGAIAWSMIDNLEWRQGTRVRFGLQHVDFKTQKRQYKKSAFYLRDFFNYYVEND